MERKVMTADGTTTFHSEEHDETYHSTSGALTEADKKYAKVCGIDGRNSVDVLDVCFGLGYNTAAALDRFNGSRFHAVGLENYQPIIDEIVKMGDEYPFKCREIMQTVAKNGKYEGTVPPRPASLPPGSPTDSSYDSPASPDATQIKDLWEFTNASVRKWATPATGSTGDSKRLTKGGDGHGGTSVVVELLMGDARETVKELDDESFDCAFFDPFSPKKCPWMWTEEFFSDIYRVIRKGGILATYSCARMVRENLKSAGFLVEDAPAVGRRAPGTKATKA